MGCGEVTLELVALDVSDPDDAESFAVRGVTGLVGGRALPAV
jgi:hypothetical protein